MNGFGFDPVGRTTTAFQALETAPGGFSWTGVGCASPNKTGQQADVLCALTTTANQTFGVLFDPRATGATLTPGGNQFSPPSGAVIKTAPSCISLNIVNNSISCSVVDSANESWAFSVPSP
jgi:hypothetical protein